MSDLDGRCVVGVSEEDLRWWPCVPFLKGWTCVDGDGCPKVHGGRDGLDCRTERAEEMKVALKARQWDNQWLLDYSVCRFFVAGGCMDGMDCKDVHPVPLKGLDVPAEDYRYRTGRGDVLRRQQRKMEEEERVRQREILVSRRRLGTEGSRLRSEREKRGRSTNLRRSMAEDSHYHVSEKRGDVDRKGHGGGQEGYAYRFSSKDPDAEMIQTQFDRIEKRKSGMYRRDSIPPETSRDTRKASTLHGKNNESDSDSDIVVVSENLVPSVTKRKLDQSTRWDQGEASDHETRNRVERNSKHERTQRSRGAQVDGKTEESTGSSSTRHRQPYRHGLEKHFLSSESIIQILAESHIYPLEKEMSSFQCQACDIVIKNGSNSIHAALLHRDDKIHGAQVALMNEARRTMLRNQPREIPEKERSGPVGRDIVPIPGSADLYQCKICRAIVRGHQYATSHSAKHYCDRREEVDQWRTATINFMRHSEQAMMDIVQHLEAELDVASDVLERSQAYRREFSLADEKLIVSLNETMNDLLSSRNFIRKCLKHDDRSS